MRHLINLILHAKAPERIINIIVLGLIDETVKGIRLFIDFQ